jgi:hypothetical protein
VVGSRVVLVAGNWKIASGREFDESEETAGKAVCVIVMIPDRGIMTAS